MNIFDLMPKFNSFAEFGFSMMGAGLLLAGIMWCEKGDRERAEQREEELKGKDEEWIGKMSRKEVSFVDIPFGERRRAVVVAAIRGGEKWGGLIPNELMHDEAVWEAQREWVQSCSKNDLFIV